MQRILLVGLGVGAVLAGCSDKSDTTDDDGDIDLTSSFTPGSNLDDDDDPGTSTPSPFSDRVDGRTYRLDLYSALDAEPPELFSLLVSEFGIEPLLMVTGSSSSTINVRAAIADPGTTAQHPCIPTDSLTGSFASAPAFSVAAASGHMGFPYWGTGYMPTRDISLAGTFSDSGEEMLDVSFSAMVDLRDGTDLWRDLIGISDPHELCDLMLGFGAACEPCEDGEAVCMPIAFEGASADWLEGAELVAISEEDVDCG